MYRTGYYALVFHTLVGLTNGTVAWLLATWLGNNGRQHAGILAGFLFVAALPFIDGDIINVRSFALVFLMAAVLERSAVRRGVLVAVSVLFSQFAVFSIPILLYDRVRSADTPSHWTGAFVATGLITGALCFLPLLLLWGPETFVSGVDMTFLSIAEDEYNPFRNPFQWLRNLVLVGLNLFFVLVPAGLTVLSSFLEDRWCDWNPFVVNVGLSGVFLLTLTIKSLPYYWMFPVVFLSAVSAVGTVEWIDRNRSRT